MGSSVFHSDHFSRADGKDDADASFSGKRIGRGLYRSGNGTIINADLNGAANILRKAIPDAWDRTKDYSFLNDPEVLGFHELNPEVFRQNG